MFHKRWNAGARSHNVKIGSQCRAKNVFLPLITVTVKLGTLPIFVKYYIRKVASLTIANWVTV